MGGVQEVFGELSGDIVQFISKKLGLLKGTFVALFVRKPQPDADLAGAF